jgi:putative NADH-flavin reductase
MKVLVVGAAGKTGRAVVERAVKEGHEVTAFVHSAAGYDVPGVEVRAGDATDKAAMEAAILGQDAVIDTVGGKTPYRHTALEASVAATIVAAMPRTRLSTSRSCWRPSYAAPPPTRPRWSRQ